MARLSHTLLKGAGVLLLAFLALSVIATIVGIVFSIVATVISVLVTLAVLAVLLLAVAGIVSLVRSDDTAAETGFTRDRTVRATESADADDPGDRLRDQYVAGELSDDEFERELDRVLESDDRSSVNDFESDQSSSRESGQTRLWDR